MKKVYDLGWCMMRISIDEGSEQCKRAPICIVSPTDFIAENFIPSQTIYIWGKDNIGKLRDALNECFPPE